MPGRADDPLGLTSAKAFDGGRSEPLRVADARAARMAPLRQLRLDKTVFGTECDLRLARHDVAEFAREEEPAVRMALEEVVERVRAAALEAPVEGAGQERMRILLAVVASDQEDALLADADRPATSKFSAALHSFEPMKTGNFPAVGAFTTGTTPPRTRERKFVASSAANFTVRGARRAITTSTLPASSVATDSPVPAEPASPTDARANAQMHFLI